jgi:hypothetical protein
MAVKESTVRLLVLFGILSMLTSCSTSTDFVIINSTDKEIEVRYTFKARNEVRYPAILSVGDFKARKEWQQLTEAGSEFELDDRTGTFAYKLAPKTVLRLDNISNYYESESQFRVGKISITGADGSHDLAGRQAQFAFTEVDNGDMGIVYK